MRKILICLIFELSFCFVSSAFAITPGISGAIDATKATRRFQPPSATPSITKENFAISKLKELPKKAPKGKGSEIKFKLNKVIFQGVTVYKLSQLKKYYERYLGKNISLVDLNQIADDITTRYRNDGYILSRAIVPEQKIKNGVVIIKVIEGFIGAIYIEDDTHGKLKGIERYTEKIKAMHPLRADKLERYILLISDLPGVSVKTILSPSEDTVGAADLTLLVNRKNANFDLSYDNYGTRYLGPNEILGTFAINGILDFDRLTMQGVVTPAYRELQFVQLNYADFLGGNGLRFAINGNYAETHPDFILNQFDLVGRSRQLFAELTYPIKRSRVSDMWLGGKFDSTDSYTNFGPGPLYKDAIRSLRMNIFYDRADRFQGVTTLNTEISQGLPKFGARKNDSTNPPMSRFQGKTNYTKATATVARIQFLGTDWSLLTEIDGQYGFNESMLAAEEFIYGGSQLGRGYDNAEMSGDSGLAGKAELRFNQTPGLRFLQNVQYYVFYDAGKVWNSGDGIFQPKQQSATSTGVGIRANLKKQLYANFDVAKPLTKPVDTQVLAGKNGKAWRFYFDLGMKL